MKLVGFFYQYHPEYRTGSCVILHVGIHSMTKLWKKPHLRECTNNRQQFLSNWDHIKYTVTKFLVMVTIQIHVIPVFNSGWIFFTYFRSHNMAVYQEVFYPRMGSFGWIVKPQYNPSEKLVLLSMYNNLKIYVYLPTITATAVQIIRTKMNSHDW